MERGDSLVFPLALRLPERVDVLGRTWFRRPELHVTTFAPGDLAEATGLDADVLLALGEEHEADLTRPRRVDFDGRVARVEHDDRATLVAFCRVDGLPDVYRRMAEAIGRAIPLPPTHVTLYTARPGMEGIGLNTHAQVAARATLLAERDAAAVLAPLRSR